MNLLGIDYGEKKVGLAISGGQLASPIATVANKRAVAEINAICHQHRIAMIIVGLPEGPVQKKVKKFAQILKNIGIPVKFHKETLTSYTANQLLNQLGKKKQAKKKQEHQLAAALILEDYLLERHYD